jgi:hypothetical protein
MSKTEISKSLAGLAAMAGVGHSDWIADYAAVRGGTKPHDSFGYAAIAFKRALDDAGIDKSEIDGLISGPPTAHERMSEVLGIDPDWGTQADAMMGIQAAVMAINAGLCEVVALVYGNDQRSASVNYGGSNAAGGNSFLSYIYHAPWGFTSQGALYAIMLRRFMHETGFTEADMGQVAVAQRLHSSLNPNALMKKRVTVEGLSRHALCDRAVAPARLLPHQRRRRRLHRHERRASKALEAQARCDPRHRPARPQPGGDEPRATPDQFLSPGPAEGG